MFISNTSCSSWQKLSDKYMYLLQTLPSADLRSPAPPAASTRPLRTSEHLLLPPRCNDTVSATHTCEQRRSHGALLSQTQLGAHVCAQPLGSSSEVHFGSVSFLRAIAALVRPSSQMSPHFQGQHHLVHTCMICLKWRMAYVQGSGNSNPLKAAAHPCVGRWCHSSESL